MRLLSHKPVESIELSVFPPRARRGSQFPMTQSCQRRQGGGCSSRPLALPTSLFSWEPCKWPRVGFGRGGIRPRVMLACHVLTWVPVCIRRRLPIVCMGRDISSSPGGPGIGVHVGRRSKPIHQPVRLLGRVVVSLPFSRKVRMPDATGCQPPIRRHAPASIGPKTRPDPTSTTCVPRCVGPDARVANLYSPGL